ncbi:MAG TPA: hypothetical protein VFV38_00675 [Ktedonobacteraceae bacterium]|nr:hypothetical protein [Ktedonobacteraceae bacterium]
MAFLYQQHPQPLTLETAWHEFSKLVNEYATKQVLPGTAPAALDEVRLVMSEIESCQLEGHAPDHHDIPWRIGYLVFCMHQVERVGISDGSARWLVAEFLDEMGISFDCALEIALVRLRFLHKGEDILYVDTCVLVPLMKQHLAHRS